MIHMICTLEPARIALLGQFVEHYARMGVERFHLSLQVEPGEDLAAISRYTGQANRILAGFDLALCAVLTTPFSSFALREHHDQLKTRACQAGDWIVWSDIDEFQVYPGEFRSLIGLADIYNIDYFRGHLVDRAAEDGKLSTFNPDQPIWTQYPRRFQPPWKQFPGASHKITCARPAVQLTPGNHYTVSSSPLVYYSEPVEIHHFKWDASVVQRLSRRLKPDFRDRCPWWVESKEILDFIESNHGFLIPE
jgi:hypothetical protein